MTDPNHPPPRAATGRAVAATSSPWATDAALAMLSQGGSAADAAVAAQAVLTLTEPNASGLGGGAMIVWHHGPTGAHGVIDGLSAAPARVTRALQEDFDGRTIPAERAMTGGRSIGVPGALRALEALHGRFGRLGWGAMLSPAIALAEHGAPVSPNLLRTLHEIPGMKDEPMTRAVFFCHHGRPLPVGARFHNPALGRTLRQIADHGPAAFYEGEIAAAIVAAVSGDTLPGTVTLADLAAYQARERTALRLELAGHTVLTAPPPAFGGLVAAQIAAIMHARGFAHADPAACEEAVHTLCEAGHLAYADRGAYVGDPDFVDDPTPALLDPAYLARRAMLIADTMTDTRSPGRVAGVRPAAPGGGMGGTLTSHMVIADAEGLVVSMTTTINQQFGSRLSAAGFYLNNVQTNFARRPEVNGVASRNAMAPGKRAMTSFAPSLVLDGAGAVTAAIGGSGGNRIPGFVANGMLRILAGMTDAAAVVAAPHALRTGPVTDLEPALSAYAPGLATRGHWIMQRRLDAAAQAAIRNGTVWTAGADPRRWGSAGAV